MLFSAEVVMSLLIRTLLILIFLPSIVFAAGKPNIVFIMADDLGYNELGCYGQKWIKTPNIDRIAAEGIKFTQFYSGQAVCAPARCVLMTGKHTGTFGDLEATGKTTTWTGVHTDRYEGRELVESWVDWDKSSFLEGLGLT